MNYSIYIFIFFLALPTSLLAQHPDHHVKDDPKEVEPFERGFPKNFESKMLMPEVTTGIKKYVIEKDGPPQKNFGVVPIHDNEIFSFLFIDRLEHRFQKEADISLWDITGRVGNDDHRLYVETEGEYNHAESSVEESRNEFLYGYVITSFFDLQGGYRKDIFNEKDDRDFAVLSVQGMAPFLFEVDAATYLSTEGDFSAILEVEYSFLLRQRTQLIPRIELAASLQEVEDYSIGRGLNGMELGLRLSHQIVREFAPYVGISWERSTFGTAEMLKEEGEDISETVFLAGVRIII